MARVSALHFTASPFTASSSTLPSQLLTMLQGSWGLYIFSSDPLLSVFQELVPSPLDPHDSVLRQEFPSSVPSPGKDMKSRR